MQAQFPPQGSPSTNASGSEPPMAALILENSDRWEILHVLGEIDIANADELESGIARLCAERGSDVALDLTGCTYIDSTGLRIVAKAHTAHHGRLRVIVPADGQIRRIFEMTGLSRQLDVCPSVEELLA